MACPFKGLGKGSDDDNTVNLMVMVYCWCNVYILWTELLRRSVERAWLCNCDRQYSWHNCRPTISKSRHLPEQSLISVATAWHAWFWVLTTRRKKLHFILDLSDIWWR